MIPLSRPPSSGLWPLVSGLFVLAFGLSASGLAQQPTELRSEKLEMTSTDDETRAICTGSVLLTGENLRITCDRLEIVASRIGDKAAVVATLERFKYLLATGHVRIVQGDREATCGRAEVLPREEKLILTEDPIVADHSNDFVAAGKKITLLRGQREVLVEFPKLSGPPIRDLGPEAKKARTP